MKANSHLPQRVITRHPNNQGSVMTLDVYGKTIELFVADAKYRSVQKWGLSDIPELSDFTNDNKYMNLNDDEDLCTVALGYTKCDAYLQAKFPSFGTDKTAKENTDVLMQYPDTEAAHYCRSLDITGIGLLDLPNIYELMTLYLESDRLDALDPTISKYPQYALGKANPYGRFNLADCNVVWSSTQYLTIFARTILCNGLVYHFYKNSVRGVVPVKELRVD